MIHPDHSIVVISPFQRGQDPRTSECMKKASRRTGHGTERTIMGARELFEDQYFGQCLREVRDQSWGSKPEGLWDGMRKLYLIEQDRRRRGESRIYRW